MKFAKTFATSDTHGQFRTLQLALQRAGFEPEEGHRLIVIGDTMDRGSKSFETFVYVKGLQAKYGPEQIVYLKGNHEQMLEDWLLGRPGGVDFLPNGGDATVHSFLGDTFANLGQYPIWYGDEIWWEFPPGPQAKARTEFLKCYPEVLPYLLQSLPLFLEEEDYIFVHAGLHPDKRNREPNDLLWIREQFWHAYRGKTVVFGHSPVVKMQGHNDTPWFGIDKIGIDGGAGVQDDGRVFVLEMTEKKFWYAEVAETRCRAASQIGLVNR